MNLIPAQDRLTPVLIFLHATPVVKLIVLGLIAAILAAIVIGVRKLMSGPRLSGGSAFLSGLKAGGPLAGFLGSAWGGLNMSLGLSNVMGPVPVNVLAHGVAEMMLLIVLGLLAGAVAFIASAAVEARIDRAVLGA